MDIKEFANVDSFYRDKTTGNEVEWREYMGRVVKKLGIENIKPYIPYSIEVLKKLFDEGDVHFNNTSMERWDRAGGFIPYINRRSKTMEYQKVPSGLANLLCSNGINCWSPSDMVCILKETARILCEEVK